ncbi:MAG: thioredoxin family protein [Candidatus Bathyarchaeia archaeon]
MAKVKIEIFGSDPPCAKCRAAVKLSEEVAKEFGNAVEVKEYTVFSEEADKYNVMITPSLVVNGRVVTSGKIPSREELLNAIRQELKIG